MSRANDLVNSFDESERERVATDDLIEFLEEITDDLHKVLDKGDKMRKKLRRWDKKDADKVLDDLASVIARAGKMLVKLYSYGGKH